MKKFIKGSLSTYVEDDDRRIPMYLKNGWKEAKLTPKPETPADKRMKKAIADVTEANGGGKRKDRHGDKQTNEAIASSETAAAEGEPVDDGLFKKEGA